MKSRSQCSCSCHTFGAVHMVACCQPDPPKTNTCHYCGIRIWWDDEAVMSAAAGYEWVGTWRSEEDDCEICDMVPTPTHGKYIHLPLDA